MNLKTKLIPILMLAGTSSLMAQSLSFTTFNLESGTNLQTNSTYRFDDVVAGADAILTVTAISARATLNQIDELSATGISNADYSAFRPIIGGVSPDGSDQTHSVNFTMSFVAADTNDSVSISGFGLSIYDTDGDNDSFNPADDGQDGDVLEFARLGGNLDFAGSSLQVTNLNGGITQVRALNSTTNPGVTNAEAWRSDWSYGSLSSFDFTLGWIGTDNRNNADNDRLYGSYFTGKTEVVPEPSSTALLGLGAIGLLIRRKR